MYTYTPSNSPCRRAFPQLIYSSRGFKDLDLDTPSIEKRFAYSFLQQLIHYVDEAHQYILEFGGCGSPAITSACGSGCRTAQPPVFCALVAQCFLPIWCQPQHNTQQADVLLGWLEFENLKI